MAQRLPDTIRGPKVSTSCLILFKFQTARDRLCEEHKVSASVRLPLTLGILDNMLHLVKPSVDNYYLVTNFFDIFVTGWVWWWVINDNIFKVWVILLQQEIRHLGIYFFIASSNNNTHFWKILIYSKSGKVHQGLGLHKRFEQIKGEIDPNTKREVIANNSVVIKKAYGIIKTII